MMVESFVWIHSVLYIKILKIHALFKIRPYCVRENTETVGNVTDHLDVLVWSTRFDGSWLFIPFVATDGSRFYDGSALWTSGDTCTVLQSNAILVLNIFLSSEKNRKNALALCYDAHLKYTYRMVTLIFMFDTTNTVLDAKWNYISALHIRRSLRIAVYNKMCKGVCFIDCRLIVALGTAESLSLTGTTGGPTH